MFGKKTLKPGSQAIDSSRIQASTDRKTIWVGRARGAKSEAGVVTEEVDIVQVEGSPVIRRTLTVDSKIAGSQLTVVQVNAKTLRPVTHETRMPKLKVNARYRPGEVSGIRKEGNHTQAIGGLQVPRDIFDLNSVELLLRTVDLSMGWSARLNAADAIMGRVVRVNLDVTGSEEVDGHDCWIVQSKVDSSKALYWVAKNEPRIMKHAFSPKKGVSVEFRTE